MAHVAGSDLVLYRQLLYKAVPRVASETSCIIPGEYASWPLPTLKGPNFALIQRKRFLPIIVEAAVYELAEVGKA